MDLGAADVAVAFVAVLAGAAVQGSIGFGMNLVAVPALALVEPAALPAVAVMLGMPLGASMAMHEHAHVDRRGVAWIFAGRIPGTVGGALIVTSVTTGTLSVLIGAAVLLAVATSVAAPPVPLTRATMVGAGVASGVTGTAAGIGGPPVALLYQHQRGPVIRSTLAATFFVGTILSVATLAIAGEVTLAHVAFAAGLTPAAILGARASRRFARVVDAGLLRPAVLVFAVVSAIVVIVNGLR